MSNEELRTEIAGIDAKVYPGMFDEEVQATIKIDDKEITVVTSRHDVVMEELKPSESGSSGRLKVYLVDASADGFLIDLPGEALGTTKRLRVGKGLIRKI